MFGDVSNYWDKYGSYIMVGVERTVVISLICILLGTCVGLSIGFFRNIHITRKDNVFTKSLKYMFKGVWDMYIAFFRYTPFIAQAFFFYYVFFLALDRYTVGIIVTTLNTSAFIAIVVEGGLKSVDQGQYSAGRSLGLSHFKTYTRIVLPQAFRNMVPSLSNEYVGLIKSTSVLSVIGMQELMFVIGKYNAVSFDYAAGYTISILIYFAICLSFVLVLKLVNWLIERRR